VHVRRYNVGKAAEEVVQDAKPVRRFTPSSAERRQPAQARRSDDRETYLLYRESEHESLADTYRAQIGSAMKAGWDDPAMDDYNHYDRLRKQ
jgi:hypothetical protein